MLIVDFIFYLFIYLRLSITTVKRIRLSKWLPPIVKDFAIGCIVVGVFGQLSAGGNVSFFPLEDEIGHGKASVLWVQWNLGDSNVSLVQKTSSVFIGSIWYCDLFAYVSSNRSNFALECRLDYYHIHLFLDEPKESMLHLHSSNQFNHNEYTERFFPYVMTDLRSRNLDLLMVVDILLVRFERFVF